MQMCEVTLCLFSMYLWFPIVLFFYYSFVWFSGMLAIVLLFFRLSIFFRKMEDQSCSRQSSPNVGRNSPSKPNIEELEFDEVGKVSPNERAESPDTNCAICLGILQNKSFTDSCLHQFCFTCLLEWSKVSFFCHFDCFFLKE